MILLNRDPTAYSVRDYIDNYLPDRNTLDLKTGKKIAAYLEARGFTVASIRDTGGTSYSATTACGIRLYGNGWCCKVAAS